MKQQDFYRLVLPIMVLSFLCILCFSGFWLGQQYNGHKRELQRQMDQAMAQSQRSVIDSSLFKSLVKPLMGKEEFLNLLKEKEKSAKRMPGKVRFSYNKSTSLNWSSDVERKAKNELKVEVRIDSMHTVKPVKSEQTIVLFSSDDSTKKLDTDAGASDSANIFLAQGMRLILNQIASIPGANLNYSHSGDIPLDSALLKEVFEKNMKEQQVRTAWIYTYLEDGEEIPKSAFMARTLMFTPNLCVQPVYPLWYIGQKMAPQVLFVLLMLGMTAFAFVLSYRSLSKQRSLNILKNDFISNMTHELKTPISTVKVALEALSDERISQNASVHKEYLGMAQAELGRLELLLSKVLNSSQMDRGLPFLQTSAVNWETLVRNTVQSLQLRAQQKGVQISLQAPSYPVSIKVDEVHMQGVLFNLVDNALKYSGAQGKIQIAWKVEHGQFYCWVDDNGKGIPLEHRSKVFDKFFRVPTGDVHNEKGYGLGLHYCQQVLRQHGGDIRLLTAMSGGSRFEFNLPYAD